MITMMPASQEVSATRVGPLHSDFFRWLSRLTTFTNQCVVPEMGVVFCKLSAGDISNYFDVTGLGLARKPYENWALCNGNNGTDVVADYGALKALARMQ